MTLEYPERTQPALTPLRLHHAVSVLSRTGHPHPGAAKAARAETAARIVLLEKAPIVLQAGAEGATDRAPEVLRNE